LKKQPFFAMMGGPRKPGSRSP